MKYIKMYELKYQFNVGDYVRYSKVSYKIYQIIKKRKKAQGWIEDANVYHIEPIYDIDHTGSLKRAPTTTNLSVGFMDIIIETNERNLIKLTDKEIEEIKFFNETEKYNL